MGEEPGRRPARPARHPPLGAAAFLRTGWAVLGFTLASALVYVVNDLADRERDRLHPVKRHRPIASGRVSTLAAFVLTGALALALTGWAVAGPAWQWWPTALYLALSLAYSQGLKHVPLVDAFIVATGFVLRLVQGALLIGAQMSEWLALCVFSLCLMLALGKRRHEMTAAGRAHRPALRGYTLAFLDHLVVLVAVLTAVSYVLYLRDDASLAAGASSSPCSRPPAPSSASPATSSSSWSRRAAATPSTSSSGTAPRSSTRRCGRCSSPSPSSSRNRPHDPPTARRRPMNRKQPLVSVVIPNYNYGRALELCLRAALAQTYEPLEVLLIDDCSTDDSVAVAEACGVRVISTGVNSGVATTRNTGAAHARGEIIVFVDSDVAMEQDAIANAVALLDSDPRIGAVCGTYDAEPLIRDSLIEEYRCLHQYYWLAETEGRIGTLHTAICAVPARIFAEIGPFNPRLRHTEDGDYAARICRSYEVHSSTTVRGRHDHDDTWRVVLRKVFHRTRLHIPLYVRRGDLPGGIATGPRAGASVAALLALLTLPLGLLALPWLLAPAALLAFTLLADTALHRFVLRRRGPLFAAYFAFVHTVVNAVIAAGAGVGVLQWLTSRRFRRLYEPGEHLAPVRATP